MAANCQACGVSMAVPEITQRTDGKVGNYHVDCAVIEVKLEALPVGDDLHAHSLLCARQRLHDKKNGIATDFP